MEKVDKIYTWNSKLSVRFYKNNDSSHFSFFILNILTLNSPNFLNANKEPKK